MELNTYDPFNFFLETNACQYTCFFISGRGRSRLSKLFMAEPPIVSRQYLHRWHVSWLFSRL